MTVGPVYNPGEFFGSGVMIEWYFGKDQENIASYHLFRPRITCHIDNTKDESGIRGYGASRSSIRRIVEHSTCICC